MFQIIYRTPGTMTLRETDSPADAVDWVSKIHMDPRATLISVEFVTGGE